jgi:hypothetical protein
MSIQGTDWEGRPLATLTCSSAFFIFSRRNAGFNHRGSSLWGVHPESAASTGSSMCVECIPFSRVRQAAVLIASSVLVSYLMRLMQDNVLSTHLFLVEYKCIKEALVLGISEGASCCARVEDFEAVCARHHNHMIGWNFRARSLAT